MQRLQHSVRLATVPDRHEPARLERAVSTPEASWLDRRCHTDARGLALARRRAAVP